MSESERRFFQVGGAVREGGFYVSRPADRELPLTLLRGEFAYVLAPRQIGKSSLRVRTKQLLEQQGVRCISIDLTTIGSHDCTVEQWYFGMIDEIAEQMALPSPDDFWQKHALNSAVHRFYLYLRRVLLFHIDARIVIFVDELDAVLSQSEIQRDDFFAAVRACYNARADDPTYERLCFCLIGVALPGDLITDETRTPFNVGNCISLSDFSRDELNEFLPGLRLVTPDPRRILDEVFAWTNGHPYMTQKVCQALTTFDGIDPIAAVDHVVQTLFIRRGRVLEPNLAYAEKFFSKEHSSSRTLAMLRLYGRLRAGEQVSAQPHDSVQVALRLTGMASEQQGEAESCLKVRNRIFSTVFDLAWVRREESNLVLAEPLHLWLDSKRSEDYVLRGQALEAARLWARSQRELNAEEGAFILASLDVAEREASERRRLAEALRETERAAEERERWNQQRQATRDQQRNILIVTEAWERFGFYLTLGLLFLYQREALHYTEDHARYLYGLFVTLGYIAPLVGGVLADRVFGHRRAVALGSFLLTTGYASLASIQRSGFFISMVLLSLGHGLFKPSIGALLSLLYSKEEPKRDQAFGWFYVGINVAALVAVTIGHPLRQAYGLRAAFGISALGMCVGFVYFIISSRNFDWSISTQSIISNECHDSTELSNPKLRQRILLFVAAACFWIGFAQNGQPESAWAIQGEHVLGILLSNPVSADSLNCITIVAFGSMNLIIFRWLHNTGRTFTTKTKIFAGMIITIIAFGIFGVASLFNCLNGSSRSLWAICSVLLLSIGEFYVAPFTNSLISAITKPKVLASTLGGWYAARAMADMTVRWWPRWPHTQHFATLCTITIGGALLFILQLRRIASQSNPPQLEDIH